MDNLMPWDDLDEYTAFIHEAFEHGKKKMGDKQEPLDYEQCGD
jgi:Na+-transporting NADH:ubiquinone oxidoreductase subunit NqrF